MFDAADLEIQERLQALGRPNVWQLERIERALAAWAAEERAPTAAALALSAGVSVRICDALLSDLEGAGLVERDEERRVTVAVSPERFRTGAGELVAKIKRSHHEGARRLAVAAEYARTEECRSVFLRRYFGEEHPPPCGTCDRCRAHAATAARAGSSLETSRRDRRRAHAGRRRSARTGPQSTTVRDAR